MQNKRPCGECSQYYPLEKGMRGGERRPLNQGFCLEKTVFASNKPGKPVYPPRAKTAELPNAMHNTVLVYANQVVPECQTFKGAQR
jgi:hypothetical protein